MNTPDASESALPPSRSCLHALEEHWDPSLDPMAISREAPVPSRWLCSSLTMAVFGCVLTFLVLVPWRGALRDAITRHTTHAVGVDLRLYEPFSVRDSRASEAAPGGGIGEPQWAPTRSPGTGGMGDLEAVPSLPTLDVRGELSSPVPLPGKTVAMGGGLAPTGGFAEGSPQGRGGTGGGGTGGGGGLAAATGLRELGQAGVSGGPALVPVFAPTPDVTVDQRQYRTAMVVVGIHIQMNGTVSDAVVRSGPEHLQEHARKSALRWRFKPLRECSFAAPLWIDVHFDFLLKGLKQ